jgi:hypothetical protein
MNASEQIIYDALMFYAAADASPGTASEGRTALDLADEIESGELRLVVVVKMRSY